MKLIALFIFLLLYLKPEKPCALKTSSDSQRYFHRTFTDNRGVFRIKREYLNDSIFTEYGWTCDHPINPACSFQFKKTKEAWSININGWQQFYNFRTDIAYSFTLNEMEYMKVSSDSSNLNKQLRFVEQCKDPCFNSHPTTYIFDLDTGIVQYCHSSWVGDTIILKSEDR